MVDSVKIRFSIDMSPCVGITSIQFIKTNKKHIRNIIRNNIFALKSSYTLKRVGQKINKLFTNTGQHTDL